MADVMKTATSKAQEVGNSCAQAANTAADTLKGAASYATDQVKEAASNVSKAGSYLGSKAEDATSAVGSGLKAAGEAVRNYGPQEGQFGQATSSVARSLSDTGDYVEREGLSGIGSDLTSLIKNNPIPALLLGIGLGFLFARATSSRT